MVRAVSADTLFDLAPVGRPSAPKAPPRKAPAPALPRAPQLPGVGVQFDVTVRPDGVRVAAQVTAGVRAPWIEPGYPTASVCTFELPSHASMVEALEARARGAAEAHAERFVLNEYDRERGEAAVAEGRARLLAAEEARRASEMGSVSAQVAKHAPDALSLPTLTPFAEQVPLWTEGALASPAADLLWLDTETTGLVPGVHQVIELACLRTQRDGSGARDGWSTLVLLEPWATVDRRALAVSGLDPRSAAFRAQARPLPAVLEQLAARIEGAELAGHNVAFDRRMLAQHYEACGMAVPAPLREGAPVTDTQTLARAAKKRRSLDTSSVSLANVAAALKITAGAAHRAAGDVGTALRVFRALKKLEAARAA